MNTVRAIGSDESDIGVREFTPCQVEVVGPVLIEMDLRIRKLDRVPLSSIVRRVFLEEVNPMALGVERPE